MTVLFRTVPVANVNVSVETSESRSWTLWTSETPCAFGPSSWTRTWRTTAAGPATISVRSFRNVSAGSAPPAPSTTNVSTTVA